MTCSELSVIVTEEWREAFPSAHVGLVALENVANPPSHEVLQSRAAEVETVLRERHAGTDRATLAQLPVVAAYQRHYRAFGQTYHVLRQLESVALKGKPLASPSALVLAMFAAELQSLLLTAGHDLDTVRPPLVADRSVGGETFVGIGGQPQTLRPGDMLMRDEVGIISAVIYGPDQRTQLSQDTGRVLFTTYAPDGIAESTLRAHLQELETMTRIIVPEATLRLLKVYP